MRLTDGNECITAAFNSVARGILDIFAEDFWETVVVKGGKDTAGLWEVSKSTSSHERLAG